MHTLAKFGAHQLREVFGRQFRSFRMSMHKVCENRDVLGNIKTKCLFNPNPGRVMRVASEPIITILICLITQ